MKTKILICTMLVLLAGCGTVPEQRKQLLTATKTFTAVEKTLTLCRKSGLIDDENWAEIKLLAPTGRDCLHNWDNALKDPNQSIDEWMLCINDVMSKMLSKGGTE